MARETMARPKKDIDWAYAEGAAEIFCTGQEIADMQHVDYKTIERRCKEDFGIGFGEWLDQRRGKGKESLRRLQWKAAKKGNVTMLIWLGKQELAQKDKHEHSGDPTRPILFKSTIPGLGND